MSVITDVLARHQYRPDDRSCSCDESWYDVRPSRDQDLADHVRHVEKELIAVGVGLVAPTPAVPIIDVTST